MKPDANEPEGGQRLPAAPVRPGCDNCGAPATYSAYHNEGGSVYVCDDCMRWHRRDHSQIRRIWPRPNVIAHRPADNNEPKTTP